MGYRSEVSITIKNEDFMGMLPMAKAFGQELFDEVRDLLSFAQSIRQTDEYTIIYFDWVKWYEDYPDVQFVEWFIGEIPHHFIRVGEDYDDTEIRGDVGEDYDMYSLANITREISIDEAGRKLDLEGVLACLSL